MDVPCCGVGPRGVACGLPVASCLPGTCCSPLPRLRGARCRSQQVVDFVAERLARGKQPEDICEELLDVCLASDPREARGIGCDNMTAAVSWRSAPRRTRACVPRGRRPPAQGGRGPWVCYVRARLACPRRPPSPSRAAVHLHLQIVVFEQGQPIRSGSCSCGVHEDGVAANGSCSKAGCADGGSDASMREATPPPEGRARPAAATAAKA